MNNDTKIYLVWSHAKTAWWGPDGRGYVSGISEAGRYSHRDALRICIEAIPGSAKKLSALPDLPIAWEDLQKMRKIYCRDFPHAKPERWE